MASIAKFVSYDGGIAFSNSMVKLQKRKSDAGRTIPIENIVSVEVLKPWMGYAGCIHIQVIGAKVHSSYDTSAHYLSDKNTIFFRKNQHEEAIQFKKALDKVLETRNSTSQTQSTADEIRKFKELLDIGAITEEEYQAKKKSLLGL